MAIGRVAQSRVSTLASMPMPVRGINDVDPLAATPDGYDIYLRDFFPSNEGLSLRYGTKEWATDIGSPVKTLITYNAIDGTQKFFAATNSGIYDITASTDTPAKVADLTSGNVQWEQITNAGASFLVVTNGVDPFLLYNGTTWISAVTSASPVNPGEVSGADPASLIAVTLFKNRLWFIKKDSMTAYYLGLDAVAGVLTPFELGGVFPRGGKLVDIVSWSMNSGAGTGSGVSNFIIFTSSSGEVAIYSGTDPSDAATWNMDAAIFVAPPVGKKTYCDYGSDVLLLTRAGVLPISAILQGVTQSAMYEESLSKNISKTLNRIVSSVSFANDWEIWSFPALQSLVITIPENDRGVSAQYFMNAQNGAWSEMSMPATCFGTYKNSYYFGTDDGRVLEYSKDYGRDNILLDGSGGLPITGTLLSSFSYFGDPTTLKHFKMVRPIFQSVAEPVSSLAIAVDYQIGNTAYFDTPVLSETEIARWDDALWGNGVWTSSARIFRPWSSVIGIGFAGALRMKVTNIAATTAVAWELVYETGGAV